MEYLSLGKIIDSFSLDGTLKIYSTTNLGDLRYQEGAKVYLLDEGNNEYVEFTVLHYRHSGLFDFVKLEGIDTKEDALSKKGQEIFVIKNRDDLLEGEYFYSDLRGCKVVDEELNVLGVVKEVEEFPAQTTFRVSRKDKPDFFVPFIDEFVLNVDIENKTITIKVIEGLLWRLKY